MAPRLVLLCAQGLRRDSLTTAVMAGGKEHYGWDINTHILAAIFDAVNANTRATGNWKKGKAPTIQPWPRPGEARESKKPKTVAELYSHFVR